MLQDLKTFKHRFTSGDDISDLLTLLKKILAENNSIEDFFLLGYKQTDRNIIPALSNFCDSLLDTHGAEHNGQTSRGLKSECGACVSCSMRSILPPAVTRVEKSSKFPSRCPDQTISASSPSATTAGR